MEATQGEPPSDPALEKEFCLWRTALMDRGHLLPADRPAADGMSLPPADALAPIRPVTGHADYPAADDRKSGRRQRWPAMIFVSALILAVSVAGYRDFRARQTATNRPVAARPTAVSTVVRTPPADRIPPPDEADRRRAELADNITHAGEVLAMSGDAAGALRLYRQSLTICRELALRNPNDAAMQRALAGGWDKLADAFAAQGDTTRALGAYREAEAAWEHCAHALPRDRDVQRSWSLIALSLGNLLLVRNDPAGAVEAFRRSTFIQETLCRLEPNNDARQEDLALVCLRLSDAFDQRGDDLGALQACRRALTIEEALCDTRSEEPRLAG